MRKEGLFFTFKNSILVLMLLMATLSSEAPAKPSFAPAAATGPDVIAACENSS